MTTKTTITTTRQRPAGVGRKAKDGPRRGGSAVNNDNEDNDNEDNDKKDNDNEDKKNKKTKTSER